MARISEALHEQLQQNHLRYCDFNQNERPDCRTMVMLGHPAAKKYTRMRKFFDQLRYACNASARYFSFKDVCEYSQYWAPELSLTWHPEGALSRFGHVYPAHAKWDEYLAAAAAAKWKGTTPSLDAGSWIVRTRSRELRDALSELRTSGVAVHAKSEADGFTLAVRIGNSEAAHRAVLKLLREHHKACVLPKRADEQDALDNRAVPLAEKKFTLGNVVEVTVTDRHVMIPLIPLGHDQTVHFEAVNKVVELLQQGYPFEQAGDWLKKFVKPSTFKDLARKYARQEVAAH